MELNWEGVVVGAASLLVIGAFHPLVIWCEYRFTQRVWPVFLIAGLLCLLAALLIQGLLSILLGLLGAGGSRMLKRKFHFTVVATSAHAYVGA